MNKYLKIMGYRLIFIAAFLPLVNYKANAQNAFFDAKTLYNWKKSKSDDSTTLKKIEIILAKIDESNPGNANAVLAQLKNDYLTRSFNALLRSGNDPYKKIIDSINAPKRKSLVDATIIQIRLNTNNLTEVEKKGKQFKNVIDALAKQQPNVDDSLGKVALKKCNDIKEGSCFVDSYKEVLAQEVLKFSTKLKENNSQIDSIQVIIMDGIKALSSNHKLIEALGIVKIENQLKEVVKSYNSDNQKSLLNSAITNEKIQFGLSKKSAEMSTSSILSETEMINAAATYLAKRIKQEAIIYFVKNWGDKISNQGLQSIFPKSLKKVKDWKPYAVPVFDNSWKYAFSQDLLSLPEHGIKYLTNKESESKIEPDSVKYIKYLKDALIISEKVNQHYNYMDIVEILATKEIESDGLKAFATLAYVVNNELYQINAGENFWVTSNEFFTTLQNNDELARILLGIIAQKYPDINNKYLKININNLSPNEIVTVKNWLGNILMVLNHFQDSQKNSSAADRTLGLNNYWTNLTQVIKVFMEQNSVIKESNSYLAGLKKVNEIFEVYALIQNKNYTAAATTGLNIFSTYIKKDQDTVFGPAIEVISFASDVLQARTDDELAGVIESHALPPASYRMKKNFSSTITIGAYFGPYGGIEFIKNEKGAGVLGFTAPVSLDFSWNCSPIKSYTTLSFIVFDLGSVVSYRLTNDGAGLPSKARWSQLFAPGVNLRFGLGDTPLTLSFGAQLTPQLRDFNNVTNKDAVRLSAGVLIDMPLFVLKKGKAKNI